MKQLICAKDVETLNAEGKKVYYVESGSIITPSAKDAADAFGITFCEKAEEQTQVPAAFAGMDIDSEKIYKVLKTLMEKGLLNDLLKPYESESHGNGLKVVRGNTVKMDVFDTGDPSVKAYYQELVSKEESHISAGFLTIDHSKFVWELTYEEIDYVIEGTLTVTIDGKTYTAKAGDVLFVPSGSKVTWGSPDKARVFYATYPANWADLV
ncbi:cupin domain-containing protein [Lachnoclostridium phytofermentans]|uniref:Ethanolamine utilisation EutQ family protein n=1 Tax=Lachnoclostridium phytofermentans (strain ATCC 700394 / DSM 18823 / ISDg) TaxID=357809 RepID=A9KPD9_LACP7|nr:cupin domain-containing protein [Lachnoclostridium phytofermentans]ABX41801.1 Ethanolamine utilisation EutQ family protein [Lachnoclostridium phytofermentans ISDg]